MADTESAVVGAEFDDNTRLLAAKAYVEDIQRYRNMIENYHDAVERVKGKLYSIGGIDYSKTKVQNSAGEKGAAYEGYLMKLESLKKQYDNNFFAWKCRTMNPLNSIGKLTNLDFQYLLRLRYSSGKAWKEIQDGLQCEDVYQMRDNALIALSYIMESEGKLAIYAGKLLTSGYITEGK